MRNNPLDPGRLSKYNSFHKRKESALSTFDGDIGGTYFHSTLCRPGTETRGVKESRKRLRESMTFLFGIVLSYRRRFFLAFGKPQS